MTGGGGGIIIIRSLLDSGRCTAAEKERLRDIELRGSIILSMRDSLAIARIAYRVSRRP